jgi:NADPH2:quinone reductase
MRHMRIIVTQYGGPDTLRVVEEECPSRSVVKCR